MAGHLQKAGYDVCVYNRSVEKAQKWQKEYSGSFATTPAKAAKDCDIVFCCVGNDDDVRQVVLGAKRGDISRYAKREYFG